MKQFRALSLSIALLSTITLYPASVENLPEIGQFIAYAAAGHTLNYFNTEYGKWVARDLLHATNATATTIQLDMKHFMNGIDRHIVDASFKWLPNAEDVASIQGRAFDAGRTFLTYQDWYYSMRAIQAEWNKVHPQATMIPDVPLVLLTPPEDTRSLTTKAFDYTQQTVSSWMSDPEAFVSLLVFYWTAFYVNKVSQYLGDGFREQAALQFYGAANSNARNALWLYNDPWPRVINTTFGYTFALFLKPYAMALLKYFLETANLYDTHDAQIYEAAYVSGDKGLFGYYGFLASIKTLCAVGAATWGAIMARQGHLKTA